MHYRFVIRTSDGQPSTTYIEKSVENDDAAIALARSFITSATCEIWQAERLVSVVEPKEAPNAPPPPIGLTKH